MSTAKPIEPASPESKGPTKPTLLSGALDGLLRDFDAGVFGRGRAAEYVLSAYLSAHETRAAEYMRRRVRSATTIGLA